MSALSSGKLPKADIQKIFNEWNKSDTNDWSRFLEGLELKSAEQACEAHSERHLGVHRPMASEKTAVS